MPKSIENLIIKNQVDLIILEEGSFSPINWLLRQAHLNYNDYQKWRNGELDYLEDYFKTPLPELKRLMQQAHDYARSQPLEASSQQYQSITQQTLSICRSSSDQVIFTTLHEPMQNRIQMDLFYDSAPARAEYDLIHAIIDKRTADISLFIKKLNKLNPQKHQQFVQLLTFEKTITETKEPGNNIIDLLLYDVSTLSFKILGRYAHEFLTPLWQHISSEISQHAFDTNNPNHHLSFTAFKAFQWSEVHLSIEREKDWMSHPVLLFRYAETCFKQNQEPEGIACWFKFFNLFPNLVVQHIKETCHRLLLDDWQNFCELEPELENVLFPAWMIANKPALLKNSCILAVKGNTAFQLTKSLASNEDRDLNKFIEIRASLKKNNPGLFTHYMRINEQRQSY